jgi:ATP-dependent helicase HrpB
MDLTRIDLPLVPRLPELGRTLGEAGLCVLVAEPGAGKSTLVPIYLLGEAWLSGGRILMLEPRRLAAASVAARSAELLGEKVGESVGYSVRYERRVGPKTRVEIMTEALLTRRIQSDPGLDGVGLVIFDEFHERSIHADLALALALEVRELRPDLRILVMSATIDSGVVAAHLGGTGKPAPVLDCPGRSYPVETAWRPLPLTGRWEGDFARGLAETMAAGAGDVLVFLPGVREISRVGEGLSAIRLDADVLPLHGMLSLDEQRRVIAPNPQARRRVILATSIAETSLTVPRIGIVADSGWARLTRYHPASGMDRLVTERASLASADQRRGRAGRLGPGLCVRFWDPAEPLKRAEDPEILRSDLAGPALEAALWGAPNPGDLRWLDPPPAVAWGLARSLLSSLGALDDRGRPTDLGRRISRIGLEPRLGAMVVRGAESGRGPLAVACAALLSERDGSGIRDDADFRLRLEALRTGGRSDWAGRCRREMERIARSAGLEAESWRAEDEAEAGSVLLSGFPDRAAKADSSGIFAFPSGRRAKLGGSLARADWIVAPEADAGEATGTVYLAAPISKADVEAAITTEFSIDWKGWVPKPVTSRMLGRILVGESRGGKAEPGIIAASVLARVGREGLPSLPWNETSRRFLSRCRLMFGAPDGRFGESALVEGIGTWLHPYLDLSGGPAIDEGRLLSALSGLLSRDEARTLEREAPERIVVPSGSEKRIEYPEGDEPFLAVRIQEVFGLERSPLVHGRPLRLHLLSPAQRPLQITDDLASFWRTTYPEIRGQMRARYPRHYWPENPLEAEPTSRPRPRKK